MKKIITLILIFNSQFLIGQTQFQRTIGGPGDETAHSIIRTIDGGYAAAGWSSSFGAGSRDFYIVNLYQDGTLKRSKTVGGTGNERAYSIIQTTDGGYIAAGYTASFGAGYRDIYFVKLDASGTLQWSEAVGGIDDDEVYSIIQTTDGSYVAVGYTNSFGAGNYDIYIVKLDSSGMLQWSKTIGGTDDDRAFSIIQTTDGGYALAGYISFFGADIYIVKLDASGSVQWSTTVGGTDGEAAYSIIQTSDGGYAVTGGTFSFGAGVCDIYIIKINPNGALQWNRTIGGTNYDFSWSIIQSTEGDYAVAGYTSAPYAAGDIYIVKLNSNGTFQWSRTIGETADVGAYSIIQTTDRGYMVAGWALSIGAGYYDLYIVKLDANGNTCESSTSPTNIVTTPTPTVTAPAPTVVAPTLTVTTPTPTVSSGGTVTTLCFVGILPISNEIPSQFALYQNYPNPFNPVTKIKFDIPPSKGAREMTRLIIFDILGREISTLVNEQLQPGTYEVEWDPEKSGQAGLSSGVYFYKLIVSDASAPLSITKKMVLMK